MKNRLSDNDISRLFEKDAANVLPDSSVRARLEYSYMIKSSQYKTHQNSFSDMFLWVFSWSHIPLKAAFVSLVLFVSVTNFQTKNGEFFTPACDTTLNQLYQGVDSAGMLLFYADSCFNGKS